MYLYKLRCTLYCSSTSCYTLYLYYVQVPCTMYLVRCTSYLVRVHIIYVLCTRTRYIVHRTSRIWHDFMPSCNTHLRAGRWEHHGAHLAVYLYRYIVRVHTTMYYVHRTFYLVIVRCMCTQRSTHLYTTCHVPQYARVRVYMYKVLCTCVCVCVRVRACVRIHISVYIYIYIYNIHSHARAHTGRTMYEYKVYR